MSSILLTVIATVIRIFRESKLQREVNTMPNTEYLSGDVRNRIRDLIKEKKITQAELAEMIGSTESTISRFMSGKTDKLSDENIIKIAEALHVSTDFLLGVVNIPDRKNYDIGELGLSSLAARNLYTRKVNAEVVSRMLESPRFAIITSMIAQYFDGTMSAGIAAQNQILNSVSELLHGYGESIPDMKGAANQAAKDARLLKTPEYQTDLTNIQDMFMKMLREIKKDMADNVKPTAQATREIFDKVKAELTKGQDSFDPHSITPEQMVDAMTSTVSGMEGATPEMLEQFKKMALPLFVPPKREDEHGD